MSMTNEEIKAAREQILCHLKIYHTTTRAMLDALCAAASQPESLVGRRVHLKNANPSVVGRVIKQNKPYCILWDGGTWSHDYDRDDFELLEGDNPNSCPESSLLAWGAHLIEAEDDNHD